MKAIVLTYAPVTEKEKELINNTNCLKVCINEAKYKCDYRVIRDTIDLIKYSNCKEIVILSANDGRTAKGYKIKALDLFYEGGTISSAIALCYKLGYNDILLVADNRVHNQEFQNTIKNAINKLKAQGIIHQYSNGNFDLPVKNIEEFINAIEKEQEQKSSK